MSFLTSPKVDIPEEEDPKIAEARRQRRLAEQRSRGRGMSVLGGGGGGGGTPNVQSPSLLGGGR
jgi:hypothetical protein